MNLIKSLYNNIINGGVTGRLSNFERISVRNANLVILSSVLISLISCSFAFRAGNNDYGFILIFTAVGIASGLVMIRLECVDFGKLMALAYGVLQLLVTHDVVGSQNANDSVFVVVIFYPLAVFTEKPRLSRLLAMGGFLLLLGVKYLPYHLFFHGQELDSIFPDWYLKTATGLLLLELFLHLVGQHRTALLELEENNVKLIHTSQIIALGEMAGGIAHEINNPLQNILGRAERIGMMLEKSTEPQKIKEESKKIINTVERISKIINGLRRFSRTSEMVPRQKQNFYEILHEVIELCQQRFETNQVRIEINADTNVEIECNAIEISQVFLNLFNNSFDAVVGTTGAWIQVMTEVHSDHLKINFTDSGPGISMEFVDRIMQPFFTTKQIGHGTGLGLSVSKGIIESHGGKLYYENYKGNTRFVILMPFKA